MAAWKMRWIMRAEVPHKRYREALQQQREQVLMSKQLATLATQVPVELDLPSLEAARTGFCWRFLHCTVSWI